MSENPYAAPQTGGTHQPSENRDKLRRIASAQRLTNIAVLIYFVTIALNLAFQISGENLMIGLVALVGALAALVTGAIGVFRLAKELYGTGTAIVMTIALIVPLIGLLILLVVSGRATSMLKQHGVRVGLLGADPKSI